MSYLQEALRAILAEQPIIDAKDVHNKAPTATIRQIRFLVIKNLAGLLSRSHESSDQAMPYYQEALSLDPTDHTLWTRLGALVRLFPNSLFHSTT